MDDIFFIWTDTRKALDTFIHKLGSFHKSIKLTHTISQEHIDFFDITVFITEGTRTLNTKVHFKPTNTHRLLHRHSFHPGHTFKGIIKGQLDRFYRLGSREADFERSTLTLFKALREMSYSKRFLQRIKTEFRHN